MRSYIGFLYFIFLTVNLSAQSLTGSWQLVDLNGEEITDRKVVKIVTKAYFALGSKSTSDNSFLGAAGGEYRVENDKLVETRDFDTYDTSKINSEIEYQLSWMDNNRLKISDDQDEKIWKRLSEDQNSLSENWVITGRMRNDEMRTMTPGDRRTIKILNGNRFQWVAFNSATKTFNATGGGTYTAEDGTYIERITFFSKNKDRVGAELKFKFEVIDGEWHHKGNSSKGDPIHEIWSPYQEAYSK
jgi:hypothetical protein